MLPRSPNAHTPIRVGLVGTISGFDFCYRLLWQLLCSEPSKKSPIAGPWREQCSNDDVLMIITFLDEQSSVVISP